jgi:hypothetical protein
MQLQSVFVFIGVSCDGSGSFPNQSPLESDLICQRRVELYNTLQFQVIIDVCLSSKLLTSTMLSVFSVGDHECAECAMYA